MNNTASPFPGMNPYLESHFYWESIHTDLIVGFRDRLLANLPEQFAVKIEGKVRIVDITDPDYRHLIKPDLIFKRSDTVRGEQQATAVITPPLTSPYIPSIELTERWIEIVDVETGEVITVIEVLSPSNKIGDGYHEFDEKRSAVMRSNSHWVEIDLLRGGKRPQFMIVAADYYALSKRAEDAAVSHWPMRLSEPLAVIGVPLTDGYDDVPLDLQAAIDAVYRRGGYSRLVRYDDAVPAPVLSAENATFVANQLAKFHTAP